MEIILPLKTEAEHQVHVLVTESILDRRQGRCTAPETKVDSGKEQNGSQSGPIKADEEMGRWHGAQEAYMATLKSLHLILGIMGNP